MFDPVTAARLMLIVVLRRIDCVEIAEWTGAVYSVTYNVTSAFFLVPPHGSLSITFSTCCENDAFTSIGVFENQISHAYTPPFIEKFGTWTIITKLVKYVNNFSDKFFDLFKIVAAVWINGKLGIFKEIKSLDMTEDGGHEEL